MYPLSFYIKCVFSSPYSYIQHDQNPHFSSLTKEKEELENEVKGLRGKNDLVMADWKSKDENSIPIYDGGIGKRITRILMVGII